MRQFDPNLVQLFLDRFFNGDLQAFQILWDYCYEDREWIFSESLYEEFPSCEFIALDILTTHMLHNSCDLNLLPRAAVLYLHQMGCHFENLLVWSEYPFFVLKDQNSYFYVPVGVLPSNYSFSGVKELPENSWTTIRTPYARYSCLLSSFDDNFKQVSASYWVDNRLTGNRYWFYQLQGMPFYNHDTNHPSGSDIEPLPEDFELHGELEVFQRIDTNSLNQGIYETFYWSSDDQEFQFETELLY